MHSQVNAVYNAKKLTSPAHVFANSSCTAHFGTKEVSKTERQERFLLRHFEDLGGQREVTNKTYDIGEKTHTHKRISEKFHRV